MSWLTSPAHDLFGVAVKATLIYGTALLGLRVGERRTLAQWTTIDFAAAVAIGARSSAGRRSRRTSRTPSVRSRS